MFPVQQRMPQHDPWMGRPRPQEGRNRHGFMPPVNPFLKGAAPTPANRNRPPIQPGPARPANAPSHGNQFPGQKMTSQMLSMFQTPDGNMDIEKITTTAQKVHRIYNDVRPMVSQFMKNR